MNTLLPACLASLLTPVAVNAASINFETGGVAGHMFTTHIGGRLPVGSIVQLGTAGDDIPGSFVEFARTTISDVGEGFSYAGFLRGGVTIATAAEADAIKGKQIYLRVFNTTDPAQLNVADYGLFTNSAWTLPAGFDSAATTTFNMRVGGNQTNGTAPFVNAVWNSQYYFTPIYVENIVNPAGAHYEVLVSIPEPGTAPVGVLAALWLTNRRVRRERPCSR